MKALWSFAALAVTSLALQTLSAEAQDATSSSSSNSSSGAASQSGSFSSSRGGAGGAATSTSGSSANNQQSRQNVQTGLTLNQNGVAQPASTNSNSNNSGYYQNTNSGFTSSDNTVRAAPPVYPPPVSGGNPCSLGASAGASFLGWGAAAGASYVDSDCADRQKIAMIHNAGYAQAARELMCNDKATYFAFRGTATPCAPRPQFDGPPVAGRPAPAPQPMPVQIAPPPPQQMVTKDRTNLPRCRGPNDQGPCFGG